MEVKRRTESLCKNMGMNNITTADAMGASLRAFDQAYNDDASFDTMLYIITGSSVFNYRTMYGGLLLKLKDDEDIYPQDNDERLTTIYHKAMMKWSDMEREEPENYETLRLKLALNLARYWRFMMGN